jgi:hypothetical protein
MLGIEKFYYNSLQYHQIQAAYRSESVCLLIEVDKEGNHYNRNK